MTNIIPIGLNLAKSVFQVHCADRAGQPEVRKKLRRAQEASKDDGLLNSLYLLQEKHHFRTV